MATKAPPPMATKAPPMLAPAPVYAWTGFYVGGHVGGGWGHHTITNVGSINGGAFPAGTTSSGDTSGVLGGAQIGFDYQFSPNWLVGVAGDWAWSGIKGDDTNVSVINTAVVSNVHRNNKWIATATGRIGYVANNLLIYVKGGAAWTHSEVNGFTTNGATTVATVEGSSTRSGWTVGGGGEYRFTKNWSLFAEYDYIDLGTKTSSTLVTFGSVAPVLTGTSLLRDSKVHFNIVKAGVNFRF